ncbi:phage minor head protein [Acidovorax sp. Be4]|uniref:Phage minor head protein n=1 Tax=Acidovorax bellezanensis TaxID=2976702 RepID=A0ABT2PPP3_9BURK|nr:phage minor head protein [Acidovorax sp. Be4]MCT9812429.1 phage minor head protein [Acidovorax sp. Be4]
MPFERPRNPAIPGTPRDRTGSAGLLRRALTQINQRFDGLRKDVLAIFGHIPVFALNDEAGLVRYGITPEVMDQTMLDIQAALARWLQDGREARYLFWWNPFVDQASQLGTAQSAANLAQLSSIYATARSLDQVVRSESYRVRVGLARIKGYEHWTGLKGEAQSKLAGIIGRAVVDGLNPRAAAKLIAEGLDISRGKARQYAQTDITDTLRQSRWAEAEATSEELGIKIGMLWTSALLPTTRRTHATRNGGVYSTDEVRAFYSRDGNRYNCHCGQTECLLDTNGRPVLTDRLRKTIDTELKNWTAAKN